MKKRIHSYFILIAFLAIAATWVFAAVVFYELFKHEVMDDLRAYAHLLKSSDALERMREEAYAPELDNLRITYVDVSGQVYFDSGADTVAMENHAGRPEVAEALANGEGASIRRSPTLNQNTFYFAVRTEDGSVLRVAKEAGSILGVFVSAIPVIAGIAAMLFALCMVLAHFLTRSLLAPIERMADQIDKIPEEGVYRELLPVVATIRGQHKAILKSAKIRQEFTANVSHELKTPLTAISGYSELIENGMADTEDTIRFSREIHRSSRRLLTLINDIIRLSELDAADLETPMEAVELYGIAQSCVDMLQMNADTHGVTLSLEGEPCVIQGDRGMMEEVVYNLCDNAIRYNNAGGHVWVAVSPLRGEGEGGAYGMLSVKDDGIGIPPEHQERIFERFYRVDKSRSKSTGGTGLGLAIVKHIVARHDAKLSLRSREGEGTEIRVVFYPLEGGDGAAD